MPAGTTGSSFGDRMDGGNKVLWRSWADGPVPGCSVTQITRRVWALNYKTAWLLLSEARKHLHTARNPSSPTDFLLLGWRFRPAVGHVLLETFEYFIRNPSQEIKHVRCVKYVFQTAEQYSRACTEDRVVQTLTDRYNFSFTMVSITKAIFGRRGG